MNKRIEVLEQTTRFRIESSNHPFCEVRVSAISRFVCFPWEKYRWVKTSTKCTRGNMSVDGLMTFSHGFFFFFFLSPASAHVSTQKTCVSYITNEFKWVWIRASGRGNRIWFSHETRHVKRQELSLRAVRDGEPGRLVCTDVYSQLFYRQIQYLITHHRATPIDYLLTSCFL